MRTLKYLFSVLSFFVGFESVANTTWTEKAVQIEAGSEMQNRIDEVVIEIFNSSVKDSLCGVFQNPAAIYASLGVSADVAVALSRVCPKIINGDPPKIMHKKYYLSFEKNMGLDSWTDFGNKTYIFVDEELTHQRLKEIILHEIAIATDAKARLLYSGYITLTYLAKVIKDNPNARGTHYINIGAESEAEKHLQKAFNFASWGPLSRAFATIRAFEFEAGALGLKSRIQNHEQCITAVRDLLPIMKSLPTPPKAVGSDADALVLDLVEKFDESFDENIRPKSAEHEEAILSFLLSERLKLKNLGGAKVTFCEFMSQPVLINRSLYSMFGAGPRPRLTGGSGGQGRDKEMRVNSNIFMTESPGPKDSIEVSKDEKLNDIIQKIKRENVRKIISPDLPKDIKLEN